MAESNQQPSSSSNINSESQRPSRPESTIALDFGNALDGAFNLGGELPSLTSSIQQKQQQVSSQSKELEELEARIKATEARLQQAGGPSAQAPATPGQQERPTNSTTGSSHSIPTRGSSMPTDAPNRPPPRKPTDRLAAGSITDRAPTPMDPSHSNSRMPGAMPETPGSMKDARDYYSQGKS